jgi:hypothetical protein
MLRLLPPSPALSPQSLPPRIADGEGRDEGSQMRSGVDEKVKGPGGFGRRRRRGVGGQSWPFYNTLYSRLPQIKQIVTYVEHLSVSYWYWLFFMNQTSKVRLLPGALFLLFY